MGAGCSVVLQRQLFWPHRMVRGKRSSMSCCLDWRQDKDRAARKNSVMLYLLKPATSAGVRQGRESVSHCISSCTTIVPGSPWAQDSSARGQCAWRSSSPDCRKQGTDTTRTDSLIFGGQLDGEHVGKKQVSSTSQRPGAFRGHVLSHSERSARRRAAYSSGGGISLGRRRNGKSFLGSLGRRILRGGLHNQSTTRGGE